MRINNPKAFVGFTRPDNQMADKLAYNLATIGQVKTAVKDLQEEILDLIRGDENYGLSSGKHGYAWLNGEGKVDVTLLPALAITDTHVVKQTDLKNAASLPTTVENPNGGWKSEFDQLMNIWLTNEVENNNKSFQKGDIVIVSVDYGEVPDPVYAGSYIITRVPGINVTGNEYGNFGFSKLAYTDGNIVKINGCSPINSAGELRLYLSDILKERYIDKFATAASGSLDAENATEALEDSVYRLVTIDEGSDGYRFGFIDNSNIGQGRVIPYTKLAEFNEEVESTIERFAEVHDLIRNLRAQHEDETAFLSGTIGERTDGGNRELSASIFAQTKQLRQDVDDNYERYEVTRGKTNDMLSMLFQNVKNIHRGLEKRAVRLYMQEFEWGNVQGTDWFLESYDDEAQYKYMVSSSDVSGVIHWKYTHSPINTGVNVNGDVDAENTQGISNADSQERVLAVYDQEGNLVNVDLKFIKTGRFGLSDTEILVDTEFVGYDEQGKFKNTLAGKRWTMLIAKTISGIEINESRIDV